MDIDHKRTAIIIGAGPAGLTVAYELLQRSEIHPVILEESSEIGGISRTVVHNGCRIDIGGHRFFSKSPEVMNFWTSKMPVQGKPAWDDKLLNADKEYVPNGPDPEKEECVMLLRNRISRILFLKHFFNYPLSLKPQTFLQMGLWRTIRAGTGYLWSMIHHRSEKSLQDFMINRFGKPLYEMFFEKYTEKVWGRNPADIEPEWGKQRIRSLSLWKALLNVFRSKNGKVETSLIDKFIYPKKGPGQFWESLASDIKAAGGEIIQNAKVSSIHLEGNRIISVTTVSLDGSQKDYAGDIFFSSMPVKDLIEAIGKTIVPEDVFSIASSLPYRDFITVGLLIPRLLLKNKTNHKTINNLIPDCWIYIQEPNVKIGRLQIFNNWSPYMVADPQNTVWLGLEYFCSEDDNLWNMNDADFIKMSEKELVQLGIIPPNSVKSSIRIKVKKAYPAYFGVYNQFHTVRSWLDTLENLYCVGRNGQHRYNNMDHSILSAIRAVDAVTSGSSDKSGIWNVNTEDTYHEEK